MGRHVCMPPRVCVCVCVHVRTPAYAHASCVYVRVYVACGCMRARTRECVCVAQTRKCAWINVMHARVCVMQTRSIRCIDEVLMQSHSKRGYERVHACMCAHSMHGYERPKHSRPRSITVMIFELLKSTFTCTRSG